MYRYPWEGAPVNQDTPQSPSLITGEVDSEEEYHLAETEETSFDSIIDRTDNETLLESIISGTDRGQTNDIYRYPWEGVHVEPDSGNGPSPTNVTNNLAPGSPNNENGKNV